MKATQDSAAWISNTYQQGSAEDNWAKMGVSYRVPRTNLRVGSSTTSSVEVLTPTDAIANGDSVILYNSTDGYTDYTATGVSTEFPPSTNTNMKDLDGTGSETVLTSKNWFDTSGENLVCWNPDGGKCYTFDSVGTVRQYTPPRNWDVYGASGEGCTLANSYSLNYDGNSAPHVNRTGCEFSSDGLYFFMFNYNNKFIYRWTLTTAFDLSTAGSFRKFDLGSDTDANQVEASRWVYIMYNDNTSSTTTQLQQGGFSGLGFSPDGKKGILVRIYASTNQNQNIAGNLFWSFDLETPYDFDSVVSGKYDNCSESTSTTVSTNHGIVSPDGRVMYTFRTVDNSNALFRRIILTNPWDVDSGHVTLGMTVSSSNYTSSTNYNRAACVTVSNDGQYVSIESQQFLLRHYAAETEVMWPRTIMNISGASQTAAPTKVLKASENVSGISYLQLTRAAADKEDQALAISSDSTGTSLQVFTPMDYQASTAMNSQDIVIDGTPFTTSTATHTDNDININSTNTSAISPTTRGNDVETNSKYIGLFQFDDPSVRSPESPSGWNYSMGMAFNNDGTRFFVSGYGDNVNWSSFGGSSDVDKGIVAWTLSTPWDISTKSFYGAYSGNTLKGQPGSLSTNFECQDFAFNYDGTKMYVLHSFSTGGVGYLFEGNLSTAYDPSTWSYVNHITLSGSTGLINTDYIYSFAISNDGKALLFCSSSTSGNISSDSYTQAHIARMSTPWSLSSATSKGQISTYGHYRGSLWGDETYGYSSYSVESANTSFRYNLMRVATISGDLNNKQAATDSALDMSLMEDWTDSQIGDSSTRAGKTIVVDNGTKMYVHYPQLHSVAMFTGPFGNFKDKYTIDISSLSLTDQPTDVRFGTNSTYTALPSGSATTTNDQYAEYTVADQSVNAEALRFKIEGDTGAEVTRFNVDLST